MRKFLFVALAFMITVSVYGNVYADEKEDKYFKSPSIPSNELILEHLKHLYDINKVNVQKVLSEYAIPDKRDVYEVFTIVGYKSDQVKRITLKKLHRNYWILTDFEGDIHVVKKSVKK